MLRKPLDERLAQPLSIETWLSIVEPAFEAAKYNSDEDPMMEHEEDLNLSYPDIPPYDDTNLDYPEDAPPLEPG